MSEQSGGKLSEWQYAKICGTLTNSNTREENSWFQKMEFCKVTFNAKWLNEG